jgi:uncharacterized protein (TIGR00251 family)
MIGCRIEIKAVPNAPKSEVVGWLGDALKVKIHAPPVEGKANQALCEFLAKELDLSKRAVRLLQGDASRKKILEIEGMTREQVVERLI